MWISEPLYEVLPQCYAVAAVITAWLLPQAGLSIILLISASIIVHVARKGYREKRANRRIQALEQKLEFVEQHGSDRWPV